MFNQSVPRSSIHVAVVYHGDHGHRTKQAEAMVRGAASVPDADVDVITIAELRS